VQQKMAGWEKVSSPADIRAIETTVNRGRQVRKNNSDAEKLEMQMFWLKARKTNIDRWHGSRDANNAPSFRFHTPPMPLFFPLPLIPLSLGDRVKSRACDRTI